MRLYKAFLMGLLVVPWLSLPILGRENIKKFFPGALFICLFVIGESFLARKQVWWWFYKKLHPNLIGEIPLIFGPFFVGTLWILRFTYGNLFKYIVSNLIVDSFFVYVVIGWFKQIGYASLVRLKKYQLLFLFTFKSLLLYLFQSVIEKSKDNPRIETN